MKKFSLIILFIAILTSCKVVDNQTFNSEDTQLEQSYNTRYFNEYPWLYQTNFYFGYYPYYSFGHYPYYPYYPYYSYNNYETCYNYIYNPYNSFYYRPYRYYNRSYNKNFRRKQTINSESERALRQNNYTRRINSNSSKPIQRKRYNNYINTRRVSRPIYKNQTLKIQPQRRQQYSTKQPVYKNNRSGQIRTNSPRPRSNQKYIRSK